MTVRVIVHLLPLTFDKLKTNLAYQINPTDGLYHL